MQNEQLGADKPTPLNPTRRTIVAGAAWSIPIVATAVSVPFASASPPCVESGVIDWGSDMTRVDPVTGSGSTTLPSGRVVNFTLAGAYSSRVTPGPNNLNVNPALGFSWGNVITTAATSKAWDSRYRSALVITFDTAVENLQYTIKDIDGSGGTAPTTGYTDYVDVLPVAGQSAVPGSNVVLESGTLYRPVSNQGRTETDTTAWLNYTHPGPISSTTIRYTSPGQDSFGATVGVWVSNFTFDLPC